MPTTVPIVQPPGCVELKRGIKRFVLTNTRAANSATQNLQAANHDRFVKLRDVAREQSAGSGESDLRRMKRQFASLKNTFILYDVKETFIDGMLQCAVYLPDICHEQPTSVLEAACSHSLSFC